MRILMISTNDIASQESLGVTKKILGQYKAFKNLGHEIWNLCMENGNVILIGPKEKRTVVKRKIKEYFTVCALLLNASKVCKEIHADLCYIRYPLADWAFMKMIMELHKICNVVVEIPTYPYDLQNGKYTNIVARANFWQDNLLRERMVRYVDHIVTFSNDRVIFGIPCINIKNGIDISQIPFIGDSLDYQDDIHLIGVARIQQDHGYDRIIKGMGEYYSCPGKHRNIVFHIVGNGEAEEELRELVSLLNLSRHVYFHGVKTGENLFELYRQCHIGVGLMAGFRSGHDYRSTLKNREYCALGLPFISAAKDYGIPTETAWFKLFDNNAAPIAMDDIIDFFEYIKINPSIHNEMRKVASEEFAWERQLEKVIQESEEHDYGGDSR